MIRWPLETAPASSSNFPHPFTRELGDGASIVKIGRANPGEMPDGRIEWAFSTIYSYDPVAQVLVPYGKLENV